MHADSEPIFTEQMKRLRYFIGLFLQSSYGSLLSNRQYEIIQFGLVAPVNSSCSEASLHSEGIHFGYCLRHLLATLRFYVVFLSKFIPALG
jgi:hypothetical protein